MAELKGILKISGSLDNFTVYQMNGKTIIRRKPIVPKSRVMNHPDYQRRRETMTEFGGASRLGKTIRNSWATFKKQMFGSYISGRLSGLIQKLVVPKGKGIRGQRLISIAQHGQGLEEFQFDRKKNLAAILKTPLQLQVNQGRRSLEMKITNLSPDTNITAPAGATHFRIILMASTASDYQFDPQLKQYIPLRPRLNGLTEITKSQHYKLTGNQIPVLKLKTKALSKSSLPKSVAILAAVGIEFLQEVNGKYFPLEENTCMSLLKIF